MSDKAIWVTVEEPLDVDEMESIRGTLADTDLSDRYEIIVTGESIDTIDLEELRELLDGETDE